MNVKVQILLVTSILLFLASCVEDTKRQTRSFESIMPKAKYIVKKPEKSIFRNRKIQLDTIFLKQIGVKNEEVLDTTFLELMNRFQPVENIQYCIQKGEKQQFYASITFVDSAAVKNALFNWFDQFNGKEGFYLFQRTPLKKRKFLLYLCEKRFVFLEATSIVKMDKWQAYLSQNLDPKSIKWYLRNDGNTILWFNAQGKLIE